MYIYKYTAIDKSGDMVFGEFLIIRAHTTFAFHLKQYWITLTEHKFWNQASLMALLRLLTCLTSATPEHKLFQFLLETLRAWQHRLPAASRATSCQSLLTLLRCDILKCPSLLCSAAGISTTHRTPLSHLLKESSIYLIIKLNHPFIKLWK